MVSLFYICCEKSDKVWLNSVQQLLRNGPVQLFGTFGQVSCPFFYE